MRKKIIAVCMAIFAVTAALTGCGGQTSSPAGGGNNTLQNVLSSGTLKVGILMSNVPMGSTDSNGKPFGYDVDTAQALADSLGVKLEIVDMTAPERIPALETHKVDIVIGAFTRNVQRAAKVSFSDPYFSCPTKILTKKGSALTINSQPSDLAGKKIGATKGGSSAEALEKIKAQYPFEVFLAETQPDLVAALDNGQIDGFAIDGSAVDYNVLKNPDKYQSGPAINEPFFNCLGVRLDDTIWLNYVNTFIKEKNREGFFKVLYKKYFGVESPYSLTPVY
jgi:polar amino acid transport system substrate-binding protein